MILVVLIQSSALAVSRGNNSSYRRLQQAQLQMLQMQAQQMQAVNQARLAQRDHRRQMTKEAAQREHDAKAAAAQKAPSEKPLGMDPKSDDSHVRKDAKKMTEKPVTDATDKKSSLTKPGAAGAKP